MEETLWVDSASVAHAGVGVGVVVVVSSILTQDLVHGLVPSVLVVEVLELVCVLRIDVLEMVLQVGHDVLGCKFIGLDIMFGSIINSFSNSGSHLQLGIGHIKDERDE